MIEILLSHIDNSLVNLTHYNALNSRVLSHFTQNTSISTTNNQDLSIRT